MGGYQLLYRTSLAGTQVELQLPSGSSAAAQACANNIWLAVGPELGPGQHLGIYADTVLTASICTNSGVIREW